MKPASVRSQAWPVELAEVVLRESACGGVVPRASDTAYGGPLMSSVAVVVVKLEYALHDGGVSCPNVIVQ